MNVTSSLLLGFIVTVLLFLLLKLSSIVRAVESWIEWFRHVRQACALPSPPGRWFWGHALDIGFSHNHLIKMMDDQKKYNKCCVYWIGPCIPWVMTSDKNIIKKLIYQPGETPKPRAYGYLKKWLGEGLVTGDGEKWKRHRRMLTPAFHFDILKQYVPIYNEVCNKLLEIWGQSADKGESVEVFEHLNLYTLDVLLRCIYSNNSNCLEEKENATYVLAVEELLGLFAERTMVPHYAFDTIYFNTASGRKFLHYCDVVHKFSDEVIMQRRKELLEKTQPTRKYKDFLDILLSVRDDDGEGLTDAEIREEVDTFMFAGHDSTANGLSWCLYCMATYQEHQELCRKEVREILAERDSDEITWEDLPKLNYLTMCIKEVLRMYPLAVMFNKMSAEEIVTDEFKIPKGTWVGIGIYFLHHNPAIWSDPEKFDPLRFTPENCKKMDPFTFLTFSAGPRNCIGQRFSLQELKVTLSRILNRFKVELDPTHKIEPHFIGSIYKSQTGIKLNFTPID